MTQSPVNGALAFLPEGEMGERIRTFDWAASPLGPPQQWPQAMRAALAICMNMPVVSAVHWGPDLLSFYNDAYAPALAERHPWALGQPFSQVWAEIWDVLGPQIDTVLKTGVGFSTERQLLKMRRRGSVQDTWWVYSFAPLYGDDGAVAGIFVTALDETETQAAQTAREDATVLLTEERDHLAIVEGRLQLALSAGRGIGTWEWDVPSDRVFADERFARLYGVDPERARFGAPIAEFFGGIHPDDVARVQAEVAATVQTGGLFNAEYRLPNADGSFVWVVAEGRCDLDETGKARRFAGVSFDITDAKAEARRRSAVADLADRIRDVTDPNELTLAAAMILGELLEASRVSFGDIDRERETLTVERDYAARGVPSRTGVFNLRDYGSLFDDLDRGEAVVIGDVRTDPRTQKAAEGLIARDASSFVNMPVMERGELVAMLYVTSSYVRDWPDADLALIREIAERTRTATERLRAGQALQTANDTLETKITDRTAALETAHEALRQSQKMEAVGQLTGGLAHDFNNLMTIIRSSADFLRRPDLPEARRVRYVEAISETVDRASNLTNQLLAFARRQPLVPKVFDVGAQVRTVADLIRPLVGGRVEMVIDFPDTPCFANADIGQFETALINLAVNARDAMDGEGRLTFCVEEVDTIPSMRTHSARPGRFVAVSVTDTGTGIDPAHLESIFEPFYTTKEVGKGTGLGLSQAFGFSKQSGGEIDVHSTPGKGARFTLYLPWAKAEPAPRDCAPAAEKFSGPEGHCVLVVEDNQAVGEFSTEMLHDLGYKTRWVASAREALAVLAEDGDAFDLVFSDVIMPGMNGLELAEAIRGAYPDLPVVLTSGYSHVLAENSDHGFELVRKPYSVEALSRVLRRAIVENNAELG